MAEGKNSMKATFLLQSFWPLVFVLAATGAGASASDVKPTDGGAQAAFRVEKVVRGKLNATVTTTGILEPETIVDIGAQVQGKILKFGTDPTGKRILAPKIKNEK